MPSHIANAAGQVTSFEGHSSLQQPHSSSLECKNGSNILEIRPAYSMDSKSCVEDPRNKPKAANVSESKEALAGDPFLSNSEVLQSDIAKIKLENNASPERLEPRKHQPTSFSDFSVHSSQPFKASQMNLISRPFNDFNGYHQLTKMSSHSYQGQSSSFPRNTFSGSRSFYPSGTDNCHSQAWEKPHLHKSYGGPNELVRGPRATRMTHVPISSADEGGLNSCARRDNYNKPDFQVKYDQAKFFMIKSFSEDDVHKSIKYCVWASTPNGNNKLDAAFRKAEMEKAVEGTQCPIFLFFSVNASGQFVGLAEMIGPVDFKKSMDFWQQDKWNGFFPVKWHIIKDIPNRIFQHIILEYNDNKAVTYSRDTQEIKLPQGLKVLQIFKTYKLGTSILDDIDFYDEKEKVLLAKRSIQPASTISDVNCSADSSMKHVESSFANMNLSSAREAKQQSMLRYYPSNYARRPFVNRHPPLNGNWY